MSMATVEEAIEIIRSGKMLIVVDDEDRENEGDLLMAASMATQENINFMARFGRGLICLPLLARRAEQLAIPPMVPKPGDHLGTAFTVSVDARRVTTGISAGERALTIRTVIDPQTKPEDLVRPGHVFPLVAKDGGILRRPGHTEAAVDLAKLAGMYPAGVICEIMNDDGTMARLPQLEEFARRHGLAILTIADLIRYRRKTEKLVRMVAEAKLPTRNGIFRGLAYEEILSGQCHVAMVMGDPTTDQPVLVRVHSECLTGDVLGSLRCDCGAQLETAMRLVAGEGRGVVLYLRQEGRGIGLANKFRAYALQDGGADTVEANHLLGFPADSRDYGIGAQILADVGIRKMRLLSNNPKKLAGLEGYGLEIVEQIPLRVGRNLVNEGYLRTKKDKMGHLL